MTLYAERVDAAKREVREHVEAGALIRIADPLATAENLGAMWGDCGRVHFWIRQQDLQNRDFSNVWVVLQCC